MVEEHVHAHYAHGNGGESGDIYILPVAVILAAVILSVTIFMTASGVNTQLTELNSAVAKLNSVQVGKATPVPQDAKPEPTPSKLGPNEMQNLFSKAAGTKGDAGAKVTLIALARA